MGMKNSLKRCPFCGNKYPIMNYYHADGTTRFREKYAVLCDYRNGGCGAESGHYHSIEEAAFMWNQRKRRCKE